MSKERLVELINSYPCMSTAEDSFMESIADDLADYILADGWIRLPCKVGQTVYYNCCGKIFKGKCHAITIHENSIQVHLYDFDGDNASYAAKDISTSREEAEAKLKGNEIAIQ